MNTPRSWEEHLDHQLARLHRDGLARRTVATDKETAPHVVRNGRRLISFASNDYLGLAGHPAIKEAAAKSAETGAGSTASRLVAGGSTDYHALEERIARHKGTEAALVLGSGYLANIGAISALAGRGDAVFSDRNNHASAVDGALLSRADLIRYDHLDAAGLAEMIEEPRRGRKLIVTETVFGMDGDLAPLAELVKLRTLHGAALMVDEAHAGGVYGPHGQGLAYELGVQGEVDLHMGTFGKAFGVYGAYLAGSRRWIDYLINRCRPFIYSTALPPAVIGAVSAAIDVVENAHEERRHLRQMSERFRVALTERGIRYNGEGTQIVPVVIGGSGQATEAARLLEERGMYAPAMRPPTVRSGRACLRFSITTAHTPEHIDRAAGLLEEILPVE